MSVPKEIIDMSIAESREKKQRRDIYPDPLNCEITQDHRDEVEEILEDISNLLIRYIRTAPKVAYDKKLKRRVIVNGDIVGALVAFRRGHDELVYFGWSKRFNGVDKDGNEIEVLPSTKRRALYVALLRAITDQTLIKSKNFATTPSGNIIPSVVVRMMPRFLERIGRQFDEDPYNVGP